MAFSVFPTFPTLPLKPKNDPIPFPKLEFPVKTAENLESFFASNEAAFRQAAQRASDTLLIIGGADRQRNATILRTAADLCAEAQKAMRKIKSRVEEPHGDSGSGD